MTFDIQIRWRAIILHLFQGMDLKDVAYVLGVSVGAIRKWERQFKATGNVDPITTRNRSPRWPQEVYDFILEYLKENPCFIFDELQASIKDRFPDVTNLSHSTLCRALHNDMALTRKVLTKRARESVPYERQMFVERLQPFFIAPQQLVFVDETSKDGRSAYRNHAWSSRGVPAVVSIPNARGKRVSALAAMNYQGFRRWGFTEGTYTRYSFHEMFVAEILPILNPWPMENSIVIIDNAKIHMYRDFMDAIHSKGALVFFLPPYSPDLNPIEVGFALVKKWIQRNCNLTFGSMPKECLYLAFRNASKDGIAVNLYEHCGYGSDGLEILYGEDFQ